MSYNYKFLFQFFFLLISLIRNFSSVQKIPTNVFFLNIVFHFVFVFVFRSAVHSEVNILICAKVFCDWNAVEVLADLTVMDGGDVKE